MVKQYPHTATVTYTAEATTEANGDLVPGAEVSNTFKCRHEPASRGGTINTADGTQLQFSSNIYCGKKTSNAPVNASIVVADEEGSEVLRGTVKQFSKGQLNCRIWA